MNLTAIRNFGLPSVLVLVGLLSAQMVWRESASDAASERQFSEQVNLALRQTAHQLLAIGGDRSSAIPPIRQLEPNTWLVRMEQNFDYDSLPPVLRKAFSLHHIEDEYNVAVLDCGSDELVLGYTFYPQAANAETPCGGRKQAAGCYNLRVTFPNHAAVPFQAKGAWILFVFAGLSLLAFLGYQFFIFLKNKCLSKKEPALATSTDAPIPIRFGQSALLVDNQKLVCNGVTKDLTYRETKLLQLFCGHANQLLERERILKLVWEDEGIIVGRSVDVFVSRLRKLLKDDGMVQIANVHGVGYRMEIKSHSDSLRPF